MSAPSSPGRTPTNEPPRRQRKRHIRSSWTWNAILQTARDPRWWPRDIPLAHGRLLSRRVTRADPARWPLPIDAQLRALADAQFLEAKLWYLLVTYLYVVAATFALVAYAINTKGNGYQYAAIGAVLIQIFAAFARLRAVRLHGVAQEADWRALILDALKPTEAETRRAIQLENLVADGARARAGELEGYYSSDLPKGDARLIANIRETAFFTAALYNTAATRAVWLAVVVIVPPLLPFAYSVIAGVVVSPAVAIVAVTAFLPLWDVFGRNRAWRDSAATLDRVVNALSYADTQRQALSLMVDGVIATATAPPVPPAVYRRQAHQLRTNWQRLMDEEREPASQAEAVPG